MKEFDEFTNEDEIADAINAEVEPEVEVPASELFADTRHEPSEYQSHGYAQGVAWYVQR